MCEIYHKFYPNLLFQADMFGAGTDTTVTSILWNLLILSRLGLIFSKPADLVQVRSYIL